MGQGAAPEAQEDGEDSNASWDLEVPRFDGDGIELSGLSGEEWDQMEQGVAGEPNGEQGEDRQQEHGRESRGAAPVRRVKKRKRGRRARGDELHREAARHEPVTRAQLEMNTEEKDMSTSMLVVDTLLRRVHWRIGMGANRILMTRHKSVNRAMSTEYKTVRRGGCPKSAWTSDYWKVNPTLTHSRC